MREVVKCPSCGSRVYPGECWFCDPPPTRRDRALFWLVDRWDHLKERWCRFWVADAETSQLLDRMEQEHELHEELERILKGRSR